MTWQGVWGILLIPEGCWLSYLLPELLVFTELCSPCTQWMVVIEQSCLTELVASRITASLKDFTLDCPGSSTPSFMISGPGPEKSAPPLAPRTCRWSIFL